MAISEQFLEQNTQLLDVLDSRPLQPEKPAPKHSAWSVLPRAVAAAASEIGANTMDTLSGYGQVVAATGGTTPGFDPDAERRRPESIQAANKIKDEGLDFRPSESRPLYDFVRDMRPDPITAGSAENIVFSVSKGLTKAIGASYALGPVAGATVFGGSEGMTEAENLAREGVDKGTRTKVGAVTAGLNTASMVIPVAGKTIPQTIGLAFAGGPASFVAQQQATRTILENANYADIAKQYDPLDPVGLTVSTLLPAGFGAYAMRGARGVKKVLPDESVTPEAESATARQETSAPVTQEAIDAAMVHNLTIQRDYHENLSAIPRAQTLPTEHRYIENHLAEKIAKDHQAAVAEYNALPDSQGGKVLNVDTARELSPHYAESKDSRSTLSAAVHEPASHFIKTVYAERLKSIPPGGVVMFTSGGTGSGKSTAINDAPSVKASMDRSYLVYDTNMNGMASAQKKINDALDAGANVEIVHVQRDPVDALVNGALPRAMRMGRTAPLIAHEGTHVGAAETVVKLAEHYKNDPRVSVRIIDNTRGRGGATEAGIDFVKQFDYNNLRERLISALNKEYQDGRITETIYRGTLGDYAEPSLVRPAALARVPDGIPDGQRSGSSSPDASRGQTGLSSPEPGTRQDGSRGLTPETAISSVLRRVDELHSLNPEMPVAVREDGSHATVADEIEAIRRQAKEGTDTALGSDDAPLLKVAAECLLSRGG